MLAIPEGELVRCELMAAGSELLRPLGVEIGVEAEGRGIGEHRLREFEDVDHLHVGMRAGHLHQRIIVDQIELVGKGRDLRARGLRVRGKGEVGQGEQDDVLHAGIGQLVDRMVDAADDAGDEGPDMRGILGNAGRQEAAIIVAADVDQRGGAVRRPVAVEVGEIAVDLRREIDRKRLVGRRIDDDRRRSVARLRAREGAIVQLHMQEACELLGIDRAVG